MMVALAVPVGSAVAQTVIDTSTAEVSATTLESIMTLMQEQLAEPDKASIRGLEQVDEEVACGEVNAVDTAEEGFVQFAYIHLNNTLIIAVPGSEDADVIEDNEFAARICEEGFPTI